MSRIIAGRAKGARLTAPRGGRTRPTSDRVREALFSALASWLDVVDEAPDEQLSGVAFLDLFAGTGAVALEAASRGAAVVVAVDQHTARTVTENAHRTRLDVDVRAVKAQQTAADPGRDFDVVFIDPPYDVPGEEVDRLVAQLVDSGALASQALVVIERSTRSAPPAWPTDFATAWDRRYGETTLHFGALDQEQT